MHLVNITASAISKNVIFLCTAIEKALDRGEFKDSYTVCMCRQCIWPVLHKVLNCLEEQEIYFSMRDSESLTQKQRKSCCHQIRQLVVYSTFCSICSKMWLYTMSFSLCLLCNKCPCCEDASSALFYPMHRSSCKEHSSGASAECRDASQYLYEFTIIIIHTFFIGNFTTAVQSNTKFSCRSITNMLHVHKRECDASNCLFLLTLYLISAVV